MTDIGDRPTRSFTEIIIKKLAIYITTTVAAGHLNTLRCISRKDRAEAVVSVVFFLSLPALSLTTLIYNTYYAFRLGSADVSFRFAVMLGMRATPIRNEEGEISIPLSKIPYRNVQRVSKKYDLEWVGRMFVLLAFETQAIATIVLVARRIGHKDLQTHDRAVASSDIFNGAVAFGGATVGLTSIGILLLNHKWECVHIEPNTREGTAQVQRLRIIPDSMMFQMTLAISIHFIPFFIAWCFRIRNDVRELSWYDGVGRVLGRVWLYSWFLYPFPLSKSRFLFWQNPLPRWVDEWKIMMACLNAVCLLIASVYLDVESMKSSKSHGQWEEVMWVDPLAEKLYVF